MDDAPEKALFQLLSVVLNRAMMQRSRLPHINSVEQVVDLLKSSKDIIVLTGAGVNPPPLLPCNGTR